MIPCCLLACLPSFAQLRTAELSTRIVTCCEEFSKHSGLSELNPFRGPVSVAQVVLNVIHTRYTLCSLTFQLIFDPDRTGFLVPTYAY